MGIQSVLNKDLSFFKRIHLLRYALFVCPALLFVQIVPVDYKMY